MKIHHWMLVLLVFYVSVAAIPDARLVWSLGPQEAAETSLELLPVEAVQDLPSSRELLLFLDLVVRAENLQLDGDEILVSSSPAGEG